MYHYTMLTAASCSASRLTRGISRSRAVYIYIYIYIYMQTECKGIYGHICIYAGHIWPYMEPGKHIYRPYIYVFHVYMCVFVQVACCIYANECNLMQMYAPLHINGSFLGEAVEVD